MNTVSRQEYLNNLIDFNDGSKRAALQEAVQRLNIYKTKHNNDSTARDISDTEWVIKTLKRQLKRR